jgi:hypothetical protein
VSDRITESQLRTLERAGVDGGLIFGVPLLGIVAEVRRLRGLIAENDEWGPASRALVAEARAIREEQGERLCTCLPDLGPGIDSRCKIHKT